ncbi:MAG TPA: zinc-binding dehydrogenase, partial [Planctomycetota bacterium]|nr:zinc-binding dehydrogenase [Planctomycetota bacterium]
IIVVDIHDHKLEQARAFGATHTLNAKREDVLAGVLRITGGKGVDHAIESAGQRPSMEQAFGVVRSGGGKAILVGNLPAGQPISIDPFQLICGKEIVGCWGGQTQPAVDLPRYADLFLEGKLKLAELVSHRFRLDQVNDALEALERGEVARAILEF